MANNKSKEFEIEIANKKYKLYYKRPDQSDLFKTDLQYKLIFSEALKAGVMTESQAKKELDKRGAWTKEHDEKIHKLAFDIANLQAIVDTFKDDPKEEQGVIELIGRIAELRSELIQMMSDKTTMLSNSAEGIANEQRMHKFVELCLMNAETNERYFADTEEYKRFASIEPDALSEIYRQAFMFDLDTDDLDEDKLYPEMKILKELSKRQEKKDKNEAKTEEPEASGKKPSKKPRKTRKKVK